MSTYSMAQVGILMLKHYPYHAEGGHMRCECGQPLSHVDTYPEHVLDVLYKNPGDTE